MMRTFKKWIIILWSELCLLVSHTKKGSLMFSWDISILLWHGTGRRFHHLSHPVHVWAWAHQGGSYWFIQRENTFNGMKPCLERETFSFFLAALRCPWLWQESPRKQTETFGPLLQNSMATNLSVRINNHASLTLPYHRQDLTYQEKGMEEKKEVNSSKELSLKETWTSGICHL